MIKSISIGNFRSIKDKITLDFSRSSRKKSNLPNYISVANMELASTTVVYGANASGKSNLLRAFKAIEFLALNSAKLDPDEGLGPYEPFRLSKGYEKKPVNIELEFFIENVRYNYSLVFTK
ncbi:MAG TPA: AAA family ATPase, partial [Candidatus Babeliaceae bacterium]|nr:AAA family ATPase [Candidatus Babeliaceae bacterium]